MGLWKSAEAAAVPPFRRELEGIGRLPQRDRVSNGLSEVASVEMVSEKCYRREQAILVSGMRANRCYQSLDHTEGGLFFAIISLSCLITVGSSLFSATTICMSSMLPRFGFNPDSTTSDQLSILR
jgi:hypothetical protein